MKLNGHHRKKRKPILAHGANVLYLFVLIIVGFGLNAQFVNLEL
jgi:hypothetical protein